MFSLAVKQLIRNRPQTIAMALAALVVVVLALIPTAIRESAVHKPQNYLRRSGADVFAMAAGVHDYASNSIITQEQLAKIEHTPGVNKAQGTIYYFASAEKGTRSVSVTLQSYSPAVGFGGPWQLSQGRNVRRSGEAVLDRSLKHLLQVKLADTVTVGGAKFRIVGFSAQTSSLAKSMVFVTTADAQRRILQSTVVTHVQIQSRDPNGLVVSLRREGFSAYTRDDFVTRNDNYYANQIAPLTNLIIYVAELGGFFSFLLLALMFSRARRRTNALYFANGIPVGALVWVEVMRNGLACLAGLVVGAAATIPLVRLLNQGVAGLAAGLNFGLLESTSLTLLGVLLFSMVPAFWSIRRVDPALIIRES